MPPIRLAGTVLTQPAPSVCRRRPGACSCALCAGLAGPTASASNASARGRTLRIRARAAVARGCATLALVFLLAGCAGYRVIDHPSPNHDGRIRFLVLHFTDQDFAQSVATLTDPHPGRRVSAHYLVSASGTPRRWPRVYRLVAESQRAWHAGVSRWQDRASLNDQSIGIEIVYEPACPTPHALPSETPDPCTYPGYDPAQIALVTRLARRILARHPDIEPTRVVGHSDIAPTRKSDPGPAFPWRALHLAGVGAWFEQDTVARHRAALERARPPLDSLLSDTLAAYGYGVSHDGADDTYLRHVIVAFQTHFRPARRDGIADLETAAIALALVERYRGEALPGLLAKFGLPQASDRALPQARDGIQSAAWAAARSSQRPGSGLRPTTERATIATGQLR